MKEFDLRPDDRSVVLPARSAADYFLLDTYDPVKKGGTGRRFDYAHLEELLAEDAGEKAMEGYDKAEAMVGEEVETIE